jgi:hypothetical protein
MYGQRRFLTWESRLFKRRINPRSNDAEIDARPGAVNDERCTGSGDANLHRTAVMPPPPPLTPASVPSVPASAAAM